MRDKTPEHFISIVEQVEFCRVHKLEFDFTKEAEENGYSMDIDFCLLRQRVSQHASIMLQITKATLKSLFRQDEETFLRNNDKTYPSSVKVRLLRLEKASSGYYGNTGASIIMDVLQKELFFTQKIVASDTAPILPIALTRQVLMPECAIRLIQEDRNNISYGDAVKVLMIVKHLAQMFIRK